MRSAPLANLVLVFALGACGDPPSSMTSATAPGKSAFTPAARSSASPAGSTSVVAPAVSASGAEPPLDRSAKWDGKWPLPQHMDARTCKTANGEPGVTVNGKDCHNPCLPGMAPISNWQCASKCVADGDCTKDGRAGSCKDGLCERPIELACQGGGKPSKCKTDEGDDGQRCKTSDECLQTNLICPSGLVMYGGTHCAKQCKTASDCPKGECSEEICGPLCPSEGCPYLWE